MSTTAPYSATEGGGPVVNTIQSSSNTPLSSSKAGLQRVTGPPRSPDHVLLARSDRFLTSASLLAGEVQECHSSRSALTSSSARQTEAAHTATSSPPVECESDPLPSCHIDTSAACMLGERYAASTPLVWGTPCVFFRTAALESLEQRVGKRKFRRPCEVVANRLELNLAALVTTVTSPIQPSQFLTRAVAFAFPKQWSRLLVAARSEESFHASAFCDELDDDSESSVVPARAPLRSLPTSPTSGTVATNAPYDTHNGNFALSLTGRREDNSGRKALRAFLVHDMSVCCSGNNPGELAFPTYISPVHPKPSSLSQRSSKAASPRSRPQVERCFAAASSTGEEGRSEQAAYTEGGQQIREDVVGGAIGPAAGSPTVKQNAGRMPPCNTGKHTDSAALEGGDETEKRRGNSPWKIAESISADGALASLSSPADEGSPRLLLEEAKNSATRVAAVATDRGEAVQAGRRGDEANQEISDGEGEKREKTAAPDVATATLARPVASLPLQQLIEAMSTVDSYCSIFGMQLQRFSENMSRLQLLAHEEYFTQTEAEGFTAEVHNPSKEEEQFVGNRASVNDTCSSNSNAGRCHHVCRSSSSGIGPGAGEQLSGCRRQVDLLSMQATRIANRDDLSFPESSVTTSLVPVALHPQRETILSVLEQVRPFRDKNLTAARVLGVGSMAEASAAEPAARDAAGAAAALAVSDGAGPAAADCSSHADAGVSEAGEKRLGASVVEQMHAAGHQGRTREERTALPFSKADRKSSSAEAGETKGDPKPQSEAGQEGDDERQQQQQRPLVVSLAELPDLSVLGQSPERATAARRRHPQAVRRKMSSRRDLDKAKNREDVDPEAATVGRQRGKGGRRDSAGSSVVVLEPQEGGSEDGDKCLGQKTESSLTPRRKRRKGQDEAAAAEKTPHDEPRAPVAFDEKEKFSAGAREFEALCEAIGRESKKILELLTFYDKFTIDCVKCAVHDRDCSDSEGGRHVP